MLARQENSLPSSASGSAGLSDTPDGGGRPHLRATLVGTTAIVMWSTLAVLTTATGAVPPLLLTALSFGGAFTVAVCGPTVRWLWHGESLFAWFCWPWRAWLLGVGGLFGFHAFYFLALRSAPPAKANLINYLWPLLIVVFSTLLLGERLRWWHLSGALAGLTGTVLLVGGGNLSFPAEYTTGYAAALASALTWTTYSVLSRRLAHVPTKAVGAFCGATALLAAAAHVVFERTVWPEGWQWLAVAAMGAGPVGLAFFAWDVGMKRGDIRVLGACAYLTPLLATALLVVFGRAEASWLLLAASFLITGGAALASRDMWQRRASAIRPDRAVL